MINVSLNKQRIVTELEQALRRYYLICGLQVLQESARKLFVWINWLVNRIPNGFAFEFCVLAVIECDLIHGFVFSSDFAHDATLDFLLLRNAHDSCCEVGRIAKA